MKRCPRCNTLLHSSVGTCTSCGYHFLETDPNTNPPQYSPKSEYPFVPGISRPTLPNRIFTAILAIFLGSVGAHKFALKKNPQGILYLLFSWTLIPMLIGVIEGIRYLCLSDKHFYLTYAPAYYEKSGFYIR